jgi:hypothetical protein
MGQLEATLKQDEEKQMSAVASWEQQQLGDETDGLQQASCRFFP